MTKPILYLGDTALKEAASYLAGVMSHYGIQFEYLASDEVFRCSLPGEAFRALVISDYPSRNFSPGQLESIAGSIQTGTGLLMIGGWESFTGLGGDYGKTILREVLPVELMDGDDRINCSQPCLIEKICSHPIVEGLPFDSICPGIGGFNCFRVKPGAFEVLCSRRFCVRRGACGLEFQPASAADPLLVTSAYGQGRIAAFASDAAPHWVGGLVDWGDQRVTACGEGANPVEVGNWYARFFGQMIAWTAQLILD